MASPGSSGKKRPRLVAVPGDADGTDAGDVQSSNASATRAGTDPDRTPAEHPAAATARRAAAAPPEADTGTDTHDRTDTDAGTGTDDRTDRTGTDRTGTDTDDDAAAAGTAPVDPDRLSDVDEWGRSQHARDLLATVFDPIYDSWLRVEWEGFDKIPAEGGALMVANHAGAIPIDAPAIMHGIERELGRPVYGLADEFLKKVPLVNVAWSRLGGVQAHPDNAYRLLRRQQQLVMVFPEGSKGPGKLYSERYRLRRFGRGGFVQIAMRAGVPIIPLAIVGNEETMPILFKSSALARALGVPYAPFTANMLLGPLGALVPFPAKMRIRVLDPVELDVLPDQPRYSRSRIMDTSEAIRHAIQEELYDMLRHRHSVWTG
jgi:1-acyl-sn-glycerol-3-phosphate acyltransferase